MPAGLGAVAGAAALRRLADRDAQLLLEYRLAAKQHRKRGGSSREVQQQDESGEQRRRLDALCHPSSSIGSQELHQQQA